MFQVLFNIREIRTLTEERIGCARALIRTHQEVKHGSRRAIDESRALLQQISREELKREARNGWRDIEPFTRASSNGFPATVGEFVLEEEWAPRSMSPADILPGESQPAAKLLEDCKRLLGALVDSRMPTASLYAAAGRVTAYHWANLDRARQGRLRHWLKSARAASQRISALQSLEASVRQSETARGALAATRRPAPAPAELRLGGIRGARPQVGHSKGP